MERLSALYASALFNLAIEKDAVDEFYEQALLIHDALKDKDCYQVLVHPQISAADKQGIFKNAFSDKVHPDMLGFLYLVTDKNRELYLLPALSALADMIDRHNNKITARVMTAVSYDERQADELKAMLSEKLSKQVELDMEVDPTVIGGPYIYADGYYIDWTVKTRLRNLTRSLKEIV